MFIGPVTKPTVYLTEIIVIELNVYNLYTKLFSIYKLNNNGFETDVLVDISFIVPFKNNHSHLLSTWHNWSSVGLSRLCGLRKMDYVKYGVFDIFSSGCVNSYNFDPPQNIERRHSLAPDTKFSFSKNTRNACDPRPSELHQFSWIFSRSPLLDRCVCVFSIHHGRRGRPIQLYHHRKENQESEENN